MDPAILGECIPIVGFVTVACIIIARMGFKFEERKHEMMFQNKNSGSDSLKDEVESLRQEVSRLRDTSTQYDISIQHTLEDMQQRLTRLESKRPAVTPPATVEETSHQAVGLGNK